MPLNNPISNSDFIENLATATDGQILASNGDGTAKFETISVGGGETPVATYVHTANKEVAVTAVDVDTDTFTSALHGLTVNQKIFPILNRDAGNVYAIDKYAGGLGLTIGYFVIADGLTENAFKISASLGGTALNLIANAKADLTKWHFEVGVGSVSVTGLPNMQNIKIKIRGRVLLSNAPFNIFPNAITSSAEWIVTGGAAYGYTDIGLSADIYMDAEIVISSADYLAVKYIINRASSVSATTVNASVLQKGLVSPKYVNVLITSVTLLSSWLANGTIVEVYNA